MKAQNRTDSISHTYLRARKVDASAPEGALTLYEIVQEAWGRSSTTVGLVWTTEGRDQWHAQRVGRLYDPAVYKTRRAAVTAALHPYAASEWVVEAVEIDLEGKLQAATLSSVGEVQRLVHPEAITRHVAGGTSGTGRMIAGAIAEVLLQAKMSPEERRGRQTQNAASAAFEALNQGVKDRNAKALLKGKE